MSRSLSTTLVMGVLLAALPPMSVSAETKTDPVSADSEAWIAYNGAVGTGAGIRLVRPDGIGDHAPFEGLIDGEAWHPDWSPDGRWIAFSVDDADGTRDLWIGRIDGSEIQRVYDCAAPCGWSDDPSWSPDGRAILFQRGSAIGDEGLGVGTLDLLDLDAGEIRTLFTGLPGEYFYVPRWAPDGQRIVVEIDLFASARLDESEVIDTTIGVVDVDAASGPISRIVAPGRRAVYPDWSPDGSRIVFQAPVDPSAPDGPSDLYLVDSSGGQPETLTSTGSAGRQALQPSWTPDGRVIFVEQDGIFENVRMAVIDVDGHGLASATGQVALFGTHPRWRP